MSDPVVSIFMPMYNRQAYLAATIDSILAQTFSDFELLIADDGSSDNSVAIARDFQGRDGRIRVITLPHAGEVSARNAALWHTNPQSKYLMNHDSDDISLPSKLEKLVRFLDGIPQIAIVGCFAEYFDDTGMQRGRPPLEFEPEKIRTSFHLVNSMINSASLIRRAVFERVGFYREEFRSVDDYDFYARALMAGFELANVPEVLHGIRLHPSSVGSTRAALQEELAGKIRADYGRFLIGSKA